jgi:succinate-acetate transporter protein
MQRAHDPGHGLIPPVPPAQRQEKEAASVTSPVRLVLHPVASPVSLGLFGLAAATFTLSGLQLGWIPPTEGHHVSVILIGFAAVAQLIASLTAFLARDGTVATAMGVLSLTWLSVGWVTLTSAPGHRSPALGLLLLSSAVAVGLSGVTAVFSKLGAAFVFVTAAVRLALTGAFEVTGPSWLEEAAGLVGLVLFIIAIYVAWASELEDATGRTVLPVGRRGKGRAALQATLPEQIEGLPTEPGIRSSL